MEYKSVRIKLFSTELNTFREEKTHNTVIKIINALKTIIKF